MKKRSSLWNFFTSVPGKKAKCDLCKKEYSIQGGSTSNLRKHLMSKHLSTYKKNFSSSPNPTEPAKSPVKTKLPKPSTSCDEVPTVATWQHKPSTSSTLLEPLKQETFPLKKEMQISNLLLDMIVKDLQPFSIVEDNGFKSLIDFLEPNCKLPSTYTLSTTLLNARYTAVSNKLKDELKNASHVSLTAEDWTSRTMISYKAVTAHYLINWELKSALLGCFEPHEQCITKYLKHEILNLVSNWDIQEKVFAFVTDNSPNMKAVACLANFEHLPCFANTLDLVVRAGFQNTAVESIINKIKTIVEHFHSSSVATEQLLEAQQQMWPGQIPLKLKLDVYKRWISTVDMIERIVILQEPMEVALDHLQNPVINLLEDEWRVLPDIINILRPLQQLSEQISSQTQVTVSMMIAAIDGVSSILQNLDKQDINTQIGIDFLGIIKTEFNNEFYYYARHQVFSQAALLDPRFKRLAFKDESTYEYAKNNLQINIDNIINSRTPANLLVPDTEIVDECTSPFTHDSELIWQQFDANASVSQKSEVPSSIVQINQYIEEKNISRHESPLKWWQTRKVLYPEIAILADKYLSVMATSVPSERFSNAMQTLHDRCGCMKPNQLEKIIFLHINDRFI